MLNLRAETLHYIIQKAREFDVKVEPDDPDSGSNPADDLAIDILQESAGDPTEEELRAAIDQLNEDEGLDLVALTWVGRGNYVREQWEEARSQAAEIPRAGRSRYLLGMPMLADYLEEAMAELGEWDGDSEAERSRS
jgi:hypothetical protein